MKWVNRLFDVILSIFTIIVGVIVLGFVWIFWSVMTSDILPTLPDGCTPGSRTIPAELMETQSFEEEQDGLRRGELRRSITAWSTVNEYSMNSSERLYRTYRTDLALENFPPGATVACSITVQPIPPYMGEAIPYGVFVAGNKLVVVTLPSRRVVMHRELLRDAVRAP